MTRPPKRKALARLKTALNQIPELRELSIGSREFKKWKRNTKVAIVRTFGEESSQVEEFTYISFSPSMFPASDSEYQRLYVLGMNSATAMLESMIEEIEEYWEDEEEQVSPSLPRDELADSTKVFVVHGRDEGAKHKVARFLRDLELEPVILDEQADRGRTIIAKFEQEAERVGFAVVLLTPDDEGRLKGEDSDLRPRARQNVVFELGYFAGALGRNRVCALTKGDVELPSDYDGVVYVPLDDSGGWKLRLVRELKAAGFEVDANRAL